MDVARYYRHAAFLTLALSLAGLAATQIPNPSENAFVGWIRDAGTFFALIGFYALVP